jgi:large subunit ribosomal protein L3
MPLGLIGKKIGHTRVYNSLGEAVPVTVVQVGPNYVLQVKKADGMDGYNAVQLGFDEQKEHRLTKPLLGHIKKNGAVAVRRIREFRDYSKDVKPGEILGASVFEAGQFVDCIGVTKGKGFLGVVGRWSFRGGDSTHGAKGWHRRSGAIGCRLFLEIVQVRPEDNVLLIKGSFPGSEGDYCIVRESKKISIGSAKLKRIHEHRAASIAAASADKKADKKAAAKGKK